MSVTYVEDTDITASPLELAVSASLPGRSSERLRASLLQNVLEDDRSVISARRLIQLAYELEPGALFEGYFTPTYLSSRFRTRKRLVDVDAAIQPYYGYVLGAHTELRLAGVDPSITDMWLHYFRQDDPRYRVASVAGTVVSAALLELGFVVNV